MLLHDSTVVTIRGMKATEEGKPASVKVSFKVKKTGKASKYSYVSKVNVIEDKQTITAAQSKVRAITVTSNKSMEGQEIKVTKGTTDVKFTSELSADGKSAVLTFASDLAAADYTVTVGDLTATVKCETSKVDKIEIKSDVLALDDKVGTSKAGTAGYVVTNQFEEDITKKVSLVANTSAQTITAADGTIKVTFASAPNLNDVVSVVLMYQATGIATSKTLKVSNQSTPYTVEKYGVYNADKKTLTATNALSDDFYYLFRVKDQYDNYMGAQAVIDAIKGSTGTQALYVNSTFALTGLKIDNTNPKKVTVDGTDYVGFLIEQDGSAKTAPGTGTIMLIPGGSGTTVTDTITVGEGSTVTNLTVTVPSSIASGSTNYLEYKATDADGNEVTDYNTLQKIQISNSKFSFVKKDGTTKLKLDDSVSATAAGGVISTVFTLQNYSTVVVTVNVMEATILSGVTALDSKVATAAVSGNAVSFAVSKFTGEDQYGATKAVNKFAGAGTNTLGATGSSIRANQLYLMVTCDDPNNTVFSEAGLPTATYDPDGKGVSTKSAIILGANDTFAATGTAIGTESYTVRVVKAKNSTEVNDFVSKVSLVDKNITASSSFSFTLTSTLASKYKSFEVTGPTAIYASSKGATYYNTDDSDYYGEVKAYGIVAGGAKVQLSTSEYKVVAGSNVSVVSTNKLSANVNKDLITVNNASVKGTYTVVINATGEEFAKEVTVDTTKVAVASLEFANGQTGYAATNGETVTGTSILALLKGKDTYGVDLDLASDKFKTNETISTTVNVIFKDFNRVIGSTGTITKNGDNAANASVSGVTGDSCTVVIKVGDKEVFTTTISWN